MQSFSTLSNSLKLTGDDQTRAGPAFLVKTCSDLMVAFRLLEPGFNKTDLSLLVWDNHTCFIKSQHFIFHTHTHAHQALCPHWRLG